MNRLVSIVDIAHFSAKTFYDALETSKAPSSVSHSSCRASATPRANMNRRLIRDLAKHAA